MSYGNLGFNKSRLCNCGLLRQVLWHGRSVATAVYKERFSRRLGPRFALGAAEGRCRQDRDDWPQTKLLSRSWITRLYLTKKYNCEDIADVRRVLTASALSDSWKEYFHERLVSLLGNEEMLTGQSTREVRALPFLIRPEARRLMARERLRKRYRPDRVRILFVGESPPASGRFFYQADSGLHRAVRETFFRAFPSLRNTEFLSSFCSVGCYLVDLCRDPVDNMTRDARRHACRRGETRLAQKIRALRPQTIVTVVRSIRANVKRAQEHADWSGRHLELPYPGRWHRHRTKFHRLLVPFLRQTLAED